MQIAQLSELVALLPVKQPIKIRFGDAGLRFPDLVKATQVQLDHRLKLSDTPLRYPLIDELPAIITRPVRGYQVHASVNTENFLTDNFIVDELASHTETESTQSQETQADPDIPDYVAELAISGDTTIWMDADERKATMTYTMANVHSNDVPFFLAQAVYDHLIAADLAMFAEMPRRSFSDYTPKLKVNFVAADDGPTENTIQSSIEAHIRGFVEVLAPYVAIEPHFVAVDVTKKRVPSSMLTNSTHQLTFVYLTSLEGFVDTIGNAQIVHLAAEEFEEYQGDHYGTEYEALQQRKGTKTIDITSFLESSIDAMERALGFPDVAINNIRLKMDSAMKHYALKGLSEILDALVDSMDANLYQQVVELVDTLLAEEQHNWRKHLARVYSLHRAFLCK